MINILCSLRLEELNVTVDEIDDPVGLIMLKIPFSLEGIHFCLVLNGLKELASRIQRLISSIHQLRKEQKNFKTYLQRECNEN